MTRQLRRSRDRAARKRRQTTKLVREGTGHQTSRDKREMRLAGRPERLERQILDQDLKVELLNVEPPTESVATTSMH